MGEVRYMISEAAKQVKVESHVLRYWEEELELAIGRTEMGHRYYTKDDIQLFCCIKQLKDEGVLLKDLKPLIPDLQATRTKKQEASTEINVDAEPGSSELAVAEVIPITQLEQVRGLIGDVLTEVVTLNNNILKKDICRQVTSDVIQEMDLLFQAKERQEEEHFRKLDTLIRQQQANRRDAAQEHPFGRLRKIFT